MYVEGKSHTQNGCVLQKKTHTQISVSSGGYDRKVFFCFGSEVGLL